METHSNGKLQHFLNGVLEFVNPSVDNLKMATFLLVALVGMNIPLKIKNTQENSHTKLNKKLMTKNNTRGH